MLIHAIKGVFVAVDIDKEALRREVAQTLGHGRAHEQQLRSPQLFELTEHAHVKHIIGVISGKGGVGKSLICGACAIELKRQGFNVGILDADITGPSIPKMFGLSGQHAYGKDDKIIPARSSQDIKIMSTNLVVEHETDPVLWRGPMLMGALKQFFEDTLWGNLDYLLIDMPPGTGDVAITVFQSMPIDGVIIVSSPQDLVQMVVGKALKMAKMMQVDILGIVENMSFIKCPDCDKIIYPYGESHLLETSQHFNVCALDQVEIMPYIAQSCDTGLLETTLQTGLIPKTLKVLTDLEPQQN